MMFFILSDRCYAWLQMNLLMNVFFIHKRRSTFGTSVPTWLSLPGPVFLKRHIRTNKTDPIVDKVDLVDATPNYTLVRFTSGRETTVSLRYVAPTLPDSPANLESPSNSCTENDPIYLSFCS